MTDNNPITYVLTSAKLDATGQWWASALGQYDFGIHYRLGLRNKDVDGLSRYPYDRQISDNLEIVDNDTIKAICCASTSTAALMETTTIIVEIYEENGHTMARMEVQEEEKDKERIQ